MSANSAEQLGREILRGADVILDGSRPWDIQIHDPRVFERALRERELGLGEAYMDGWFDVEDLCEFLCRLVTADLQGEVTRNPRVLAAAARQLLFNRQTIRKAAKNASAHYDIGNDLYERMLDKRMIYSCAYWRSAHDLDTAQEAKLDLICRKLQLEPGMQVLDIGCGWGGFAAFAAERYSVEVTGISPAVEQVTLASQRCAELPVRIIQADYRKLSGSFDRIVSIGMMEHVGPRNLATFFDRCNDLLAPDGMMLHHTIGSNDSKRRLDPWFDKYIFPGGVLPSIAQIAKTSSGTWVIEDVHNFGPDYDRTLHAWSANIEARWSEIPHYDQRFRRMWHYYLMASAAGFRTRSTQLFQVVFTRPRRRSDVYAAVR